MMKATATSDIDVALVAELRAELAGEVEIEEDVGAIFLRSAEPPSWIQFFADAQWWVKALGAYAALYFAELVKEAAKETWKERAQIARGAVGATNKVARLARGLFKLRSGLPERTQLILGLPVPDDYFGARIHLIGRTEDLLAAEIALFIRHMPALAELIEAEGLRSNRVLGAINLVISDDGSLFVSWIEGEAFNLQERRLPLPDEA